MPGRRTPPPRLVQWVVSRLVGPTHSADVLGDLEELAGDRAGPGRTLWYWSQVLQLLGRTMLDGALGEGSPSRRAPTLGLSADLRFALRSYRRSPVVALTILLTLALGVGANAAIFSVIDAVLIRPLPFPEAERLVLVWEREPHQGLLEPFSPPSLDDARNHLTGLDALAGWVPERYSMTGDGEPEQILVVRVTEDFFPIMGARPLHGRVFEPGIDPDPGTVVLSHGFWARRFGADPGVVGRTITLDYAPYLVVGVMRPGFQFPDDPDIAAWMPLVRFSWEEFRHTRNTRAIGRLAGAVTLERVREEAKTVAERLAVAHPETNEGYGMAVEYAAALMGGSGALATLMGAVVLVLLIACANVANLLLARASDREREISVRRALGASRGRIFRQLLVESGVLACLGSLLGVAVAWIGVRLLVSLEPGTLPGWNPVAINGHVLVFTLGLALFVTLAAGLVPALRSSRQNTAGGLHSRSTRPGDRAEGRRTRALLSALEVAMAVVLLSAGGLLVSSLSRLSRVDPGFEPDGLLSATIELPGNRYEYGSGEMERAFQDILEATRSQPSIVQAGWVTTLPMNPVGTDYDIEFYLLENPERTPVDAPVRADFRVASAGYFETLRVPLLAGRTLADSDRADGLPVAVVNQALVDRFFPGERALGRHIQVYAPEGDGYEIVGVVGNLRHRGLDDMARPEIYLPYRQMTHGDMTLVLRHTGNMTGAVGALRLAVDGVDPDLPLIAVSDVPTLLNDSVAERRFYMILLLVFSGVGLVLAVVGVYGTLSFSVNRRRQEIGIRMAIGAERSRVVRLVVFQGLRIVAGGVLAGVVAAAFLTRGLQSMLYGVEPGDPATVLGVVGVVTLTALAACWLPAKRASLVQPSRALRDG